MTILCDYPYKQYGPFSWFELMTTDVAAAETFSIRLFGLKTENFEPFNLIYRLQG